MTALLACQYNLSSGYLPDEIIINILMNLDANSLKNQLFVCKLFRNLIFTNKKIFIRNFIKNHPHENFIWSKVDDNFLLGLQFQQFTLSNIFEIICNENGVINFFSNHIKNLRALKMFYIMTVYYNKIDPHVAAVDICRLNNKGAYHYYLITSKYPDIVSRYLDDIADDILWLIHNYDNMDEFYSQVDKAIDIGGTASDAFHTICLNDYNTYYRYLEFGIPSKDAEEFSYSGNNVFSEELLITYKGLVPIIGKTYSVYFVLEMNMQYEGESLIHILSMLYRNNIENIEIAETVINNYS